MDFFDKITKKASETYKGASEKTNKIARETKLKMKMSDNKSKIEDLYEEIGKKVYQKHVANEDLNIKEDIKEECEKIDTLADEVEKYQKEIWDLNDNKQCPNCKAKISKDVTFCPNCGAKQEEEVVCEVEIVDESQENIQEETTVETETTPKTNSETEQVNTQESAYENEQPTNENVENHEENSNNQ